MPIDLAPTAGTDLARPMRGGASVTAKLRVAMVLPGLGPGGSEGVVSFIANIWAERGWRVSIVTLEGGLAPAYYPIDPRVDIRRLDVPVGRSHLLRALWMAAKRVRLLRREFQLLSPDLIISFLTRTNVLTLMATTGLGIPVIVSERNNPELQTVGPTWSWLRRRLYPRAFGLVTMTKGAMNLFPPKLRARDWIIPNQVNLPTDLQLNRGNKILAAVGRLVPQKGFDLLLDAFARIAATHPDWTLVIWGEGPERRRLTAQRDELGLRDRVLFPGVSERPGVWIETADVFVLSSRYEGWGIVLMEAMAAGLPVISFDCRFGPGEMITDGEDGLLVPNGDVDALATALSRLIRDESLRRQLGDGAAHSALRFTSERIMERWDEVIRAVVAHRRPG